MSDDRNPMIDVSWEESVTRKRSVSLPLETVRALIAEHAPSYDATNEAIHDTLSGATWNVQGLSALFVALAGDSQPETETLDDINDVETSIPDYVCECGAFYSDHCTDCEECECECEEECEECGEAGCDGECEEETDEADD